MTKRQRNKSSPQTLSSPKKYRQTVTSDKTAHTDTDTDNISDNISAVSGVSVSQEVPVSKLPDLPETDSEEGDTLIMDPVNLQASQSNIGEAHGSFDLHSNEPGMSLEFSGEPDPIPDQSHGTPVHHAPQNMNFHPANMANIAHPLHLLPQMQPVQAFQHPIASPSLYLSEEDVVRIASKMNELISDNIKILVKTQVDAVIVPLREELNKTQSDLATVQKELKKV